jgi:hypothetical protein
LIKDIRSNHSSLLVAGFIGIFLSIPFLPPIDGGARFYASTTPFFFVLPAVAVYLLSKKMGWDTPLKNDWKEDTKISQALSIIVIVMTMIMPIVLYATRSFSRVPDRVAPHCQAEQAPFAIELHPGSYIDLVKDNPTQCSGVPDVCFDEFKWNNTEKGTDDFYQELFHLTENAKTNARIIPAVDWIENKPHYFYLSHDKLPGDLAYGLLSGCATETRTTYQSIYKVESMLIESE